MHGNHIETAARLGSIQQHVAGAIGLVGGTENDERFLWRLHEGKLRIRKALHI
jgi:hypothetical protein